jgi:hypothetical protein
VRVVSHEAYEITQCMDWIKASVFALIHLRWSSKGSSVTGWDTDSLPGSYSRPLARIRGEKVKRRGELGVFLVAPEERTN